MTRELLTGADFKGPLQINGSAGTSGQLLASQGDGAIPQWVAAGGFSGGTLTSNLTLASGTTSLSPLTLQSGTNLTTAVAGAVEYDGKVVYSTPAGRGVSPSMMFYRLNANLTGSNVSTEQPVYGVGVTLQAGTIYAFSGIYQLQKSTNSTSHTIGTSFGGTATLNNINAGILWTRAAVATASANMDSFSAYHAFATSAANLVLTGSIATANQTFVARIAGTVSINAGGTFIPQYKLSANGGPYATLAGSYFSIWPIGAAGANVSVGPWA